MKIFSAFGLVSLAMLAAGCMPAVPKRTDALSMLTGQGASRNSAVKRLRLAIIFSENSRNAAVYLQKATDSVTGQYGGVSDVAFFKSVVDSLEKAFASVVAVDNLEQARAEGAHLAAIVDIYAKVGTVSFAMTTADVGAAFQSLNGVPIGEARAAAVDSFALALSTNAELAAYAADAAPSASVASAPAAVAPPTTQAKSYHSDVAIPSFRLSEDESKFALVVGVEKYASLPSAEHAVRDAKAIKAHLLAAGYPERNIVLLTDQQAYLVPWDGDPKFLANTGYPVKRLYERLNALKAKRVLVVMDACFTVT